MPKYLREHHHSLENRPSVLKTGKGFGVALIKDGEEVGKEGVDFFRTATLGRIADFNQMENGLLAITVLGETRIQLENVHQQPDGLWVADSTELPERGGPLKPEEVQDLDACTDLLGKLIAHNLMSHVRSLVDPSSPVQVMNYLIMLLPITVHQKQALLEVDHLGLRWSSLLECIVRLEEKANR